MVDYDNVFFNIAAFIGGLFVLEFGADKFVDHTAKIAQRTRIPPTLIALLTAGAEWEELVVVIASISQSQSPLALGNILGSSISNILGAFSLGLIFSPAPISFDSSSKIYTGVLFGITTFFSLFILFFEPLGKFGGALLIAIFVGYTASIAWAIYQGLVAPPVDSDSDSSDSDSDSDSDSETEADSVPLKEKPAHTTGHLRSRSSTSVTTIDIELGTPKPVSLPLAKEMFDDMPTSSQPFPNGKKPAKSVLYHTIQIIIGFVALSLSGYILSHSISTLAVSLSLSTTVLGTTILSLATTLPEKLISIFSARRNQSGIVVANTAGSNIFLLTLCAGVLFVSGDLASLKDALMWWEVAAMWASSALLFVIVMLGGRSWMGWSMFVAYVVFIAMEFVMDRGEGEVAP